MYALMMTTVQLHGERSILLRPPSARPRALHGTGSDAPRARLEEQLGRDRNDLEITRIDERVVAASLRPSHGFIEGECIALERAGEARREIDLVGTPGRDLASDPFDMRAERVL